MIGKLISVHKRGPLRQIGFDMQQFDEFTFRGSCQGLANFAFRSANRQLLAISQGPYHQLTNWFGIHYCCFACLVLFG